MLLQFSSLHEQLRYACFQLSRVGIELFIICNSSHIYIDTKKSNKDNTALRQITEKQVIVLQLLIK